LPKTFKIKKQKIMKKISLMLFFIFSSISYSQSVNKEITGALLDENSMPLPGVSIVVKGTSTGASTDLDGLYTIMVPNVNSILLFSYIGYENREVVVGNQTTISIKLIPMNNALEEVVVTGYGSQRKKDITGAISSVNAEDLLNVPTISVAEMLRGRVAGLEVNISSSRPGSGSDILIRGKRSLSGSNGPLFVVDGSPVTNIDDINANDIKTLEVLKDAASQAIYGSRASAGVILITTKRGGSGKTVIDFNVTSTYQDLKKNFDLMSGSEWTQMLMAQQSDFRPLSTVPNNEIQAYMGDDLYYNNYLAGRQSNWIKELISPAMMKSYNLGMRGGSETTKVSASLNYMKQDGMIAKTGFDRITGRLNIDQRVSQSLKVGINTSYSLANQGGEDGISGGSSGSTSSMYQKAFTYAPYANAYETNGSLSRFVNTDLRFNPLWNSQEASDNRATSRFQVNMFADWEITKGLTYRFNGNYSSREENRESYESRLHERGARSNGWGQLRFAKDNEWLAENILTYEQRINENNRFDITLVQSSNVTRGEGYTQVGTEFLTDYFGANGISSASQFNVPERSIVNRQLLSYMARVRYTFLERYTLSGSLRKDGSSVFGSENKWGLFPSLSAAWVIKEEPFLKDIDFVSNLKLRASYGEVGNQGIGAYQTTSRTQQSEMLFGNDSEYSIGLLPGNILPNPFLKWEKTASVNLGLDFGFFRNRVTGSFELYDTRTTDLLVYNNLPVTTGYSSQLSNLGEVSNKGIEIQASTVLLKNKNFSWSANLTWSKNVNKIVSIDGKTDENGIPLDQPNNNWFIGYSIDSYYRYKSDGIFNTISEVANSAQGRDPSSGNPLPDAQIASKVGSIRVGDLNGDGVITEADREIVNQNPDWIGSLSMNFDYKGINLMVDFYTVQGTIKDNSLLYDYNTGGTYSGKLNGIKRDYWTPDGLGQEAPLPRNNSTDPYAQALGLTDASYFRIRNLKLGYTLPNSKWMSDIGISNLNMYVSATNYFTWTKYKSFSPESNPTSYPEARLLNLGINLSL